MDSLAFLCRLFFWKYIFYSFISLALRAFLRKKRATKQTKWNEINGRKKNQHNIFYFVLESNRQAVTSSSYKITTIKTSKSNGKTQRSYKRIAAKMSSLACRYAIVIIVVEMYCACVCILCAFFSFVYLLCMSCDFFSNVFHVSCECMSVWAEEQVNFIRFNWSNIFLTILFQKHF